ncbi:DUF6273 domain-containing protein [Adlercreutzia mucosicola]|uniref:DUF6273 domain-containing protein n=1 Tax=Adlercreutzia mucosicola TaxID=580026 RepID=UPI002B243397|nr:DUF6273 domain-containing protein [Adlercreutzia mucosicola]MEB1813881.1 DUF6273 domain-containing protein [Adlercreutzia mucosicola]
MKIGIIAAVAVVVVVLVAGFATNWFGLAGVQPKEAVDVPAPAQSEQPNDSVAESGSQADGSSAQAGAAVKSAVEAYTWDELSQISNEIAAAGSEDAAIEVAKRYNLCTPDGKLDGTQVKSVTLSDGTQTAVQIAGFAHDDKTSGGKAGITFIFGESIAEAPMNTTDTNAGGWEGSQMRAYLNSDGMALLPDELSSVVVPVDKLSNNVGETETTSSVTVTSDSLWLFSLPELGGNVPEDRIGDGYGLYEDIYVRVFDAAGFQYKLFRDAGASMSNSDNAILVKTQTDTYSFWWLRTSDSRDSYNFLRVDQHGYVPAGGDAADFQRGVVPGFCI